MDPRQAERLQRIMLPLLRAMNYPPRLRKAKVGIIDTADINAANAGGGELYITTGLLAKAQRRVASSVFKGRESICA